MRRHIDYFRGLAVSQYRPRLVRGHAGHGLQAGGIADGFRGDRAEQLAAAKKQETKAACQDRLELLDDALASAARRFGCRKRASRRNPMEAAIMRTAAALLALCLAAASSTADAERGFPSGENGRFSFREVPDGLLRLDTRTGEVSLCSKRPAGWACEALPDARTALENEIARLQDQNARLKRELISRGLALPGDTKGEPRVAPPADQGGKLPSDAELDRMMTLFEKIWRRLVDMVQSMQKQMEQKQLDQKPLDQRGMQESPVTGKPPV